MTIGSMIFSNVDDMKIAMKDYLRSGSATVIFEKADGTMRTMVCTLNGDIITEAMPQKETVPISEILQNDLVAVQSKELRPEYPNVISVWDIEKNDWRSIRLDRIKSLDDMDVKLCLQ